MSRALRAAAALGLLGALAVGGPAQAAFAPCGSGGSVEDRGNGWVASRPSYPAGPAATTLLSAPAYDSNLLLASNGTVVVRSLDAGCSWQPVFSATSTPGLLPTESPVVTALQMASSANSTRYGYVGITAVGPGGVSRPFIAVSSNRATSFVAGNQGLPTLGSVVEVVANPTVPQIAFAVVDKTLTLGGREVVATSDGGGSWASRTGTGGAADVSELAADPLGQTGLVARAAGRVLRSNDGGASFAPVTGDPGTVTHLVATQGPRGLQLGVALTGSAAGVSDDGGASWRRVRTPFVPKAVGLGPLTGFVAVSDGARQVAAIGLTSQRVNDIAPTRGAAPSTLSLSTPTAAGFAAVGLGGGDVLRVPLTVGGLPIVQPQLPGHVLRPIQLMPPGGLAQFPSTLLPVRTDLVLRSGTSRLVPYDLLVPRTPTPVDVMFLVDSTSSMESVIESLRANIRQLVGALDTAGLNIRFGIADFRDYPQPQGTAVQGDWPYRLRRRIGPVDAELQAAINSIQTGGGTTDGGDSALTAVTQAVTGRGDGDWVAKGQGAQFRAAALKLVMSAVDTNIHEGGKNYGSGPNPGPTVDSTVRDLQQTGVRSIGLAIGDLPVPTLRTLAVGSHALAPPAGIDCDGDGKVDLRGGAPLVCQISSGSTTSAGGVVVVSGVNVSSSSSSTGLPAAVVSLASGQQDVKPVSLVVAQGASVARVVSAPSFRVDLHADNRLGYLLKVTCPSGASHRTIGLQAVAGAAPLASGVIGLTCSPNAPLAPPPAVVAPAVPPAAPAPPAAPNPPAPNPNPNPNPNVNPAANVNVNTGVVDQEQDQPQLALAESDVLQTSFVGAAALMLAGACGVVAARRGQLSLGWSPGAGRRSRR